MSTNLECQLPHCHNEATHRIENTGTGKVWVMCEWHKAQYTRDKVMISTGRIKEAN